MANWAERLRAYFLKKRLKNLNREQRSSNMDTVRTIGILFNATNPDLRKIVEQYAQALQTRKKNVKLLGQLNDKQEKEHFPFPVFNKKDLDWLKRPKSAEAEAFQNTAFDMLIALSTTPSVAEQQIITLSPAQMKIGPYIPDFKQFDFMIDLNDSQDAERFFEQMEHYLKTIHPNPKRHERSKT